MPYSDDDEHSPSEFYYPDEISDETNDPINGRLEGENAEQNNNKNSQEKIEEFILNQKAKTTITKTDMKIRLD